MYELITQFQAMATKRPRFLIRRIRNGSVVIKDTVFRPDETHMKYDGRLEGMRYAFGLYWTGDEWNNKFVYLWGPEEMYRAATDDEDRYKEMHGKTPDCVDGVFVWQKWNADKAPD